MPMSVITTQRPSENILRPMNYNINPAVESKIEQLRNTTDIEDVVNNRCRRPRLNHGQILYGTSGDLLLINSGSRVTTIDAKLATVEKLYAAFVENINLNGHPEYKKSAGATIKELYAPQIALLPVGGNYTMDVDHAAMAARWLGVRTVIPMHYYLPPHIDVNPQDFAKLFQNSSVECFVLDGTTDELIVKE
mgnify:CR=1 FL=1